MDLDWLRDFLALAEHGNFSRAADARNVTQPAFSRRIRALEDWIGTALFVRGAHGATLTAAGHTFEPFARDLSRDIDRARRAARSAGEEHTASLAIAATHALSFTFFPRWITRHLGLDALGTLNLVSDSMEGCERTLLAGEVQFLLCHHHPAVPPHFDADRFASVCVGTDVLAPFCAPDRDGRPQWPVSTCSDTSSRMLDYSPASGLGRILAVQARQRTSAGTHAPFTSHLAAALLGMARDGQGAAWLPLTLVEEDVRGGRLVRAAPEAEDIAIEIRLFRSPDCRNRAADRLWDEMCSAHAGETRRA